MNAPIHDQDQRDLALDATRSYIVQAPAGSGKTELLIQRFLILLAQVDKPEHILAMTFTRKAAGEMQTRIIKALTHAAQEPPPDYPHSLKTYHLAKKVLEQDARQKWNLLNNPTRLKVQTIDSFCMSLIRQTPVLSGIGSLLGIEEKTDALYRETARRVLANVEKKSEIGESVRGLLKRLDNDKNKFLERMVQLLDKRDRWMLTFFQTDLEAPSPAESRAEQEKALTTLIEARLQAADSHFGHALKEQLLPLLRYAGNNMHAENPDHELAIMATISVFPKPTLDHLPVWKAIAKLLVTDKAKFRKTVDKRNGFPPDKKDDDKKPKESYLNLLASLPEQDAFAKELGGVSGLPNPRFEDSDWEFLESMFRLLPEIEKTLRRVFVESGNTDYSELSLSALKSLGKPMTPSDLLLKYDLKLQHILVDEFQDTSYKQYQLLSLLTEGWTPGDGRTLFIVGDPMQSIYRFRDAEVSFFNKVKEGGIGPVHLDPLQLSSNFRSQSRLVSWTNACFDTLDREAASAGSIDLEGAVAYTPSHAERDAGLQPAVVYHPFLNTNAEQEAFQMIDVIHNLQSAYPDASIAILVRSRTHLESLVPHLQEAKIPLRAEDIDKITSRPAVLDLWSLMRALLDPHDRIAWLSVLRAPFCGFLLEDLHRLCRMDAETPAWQLMNDPERQQALTTDGQTRLARVIEKLTPVLQALTGEDFRDLLEGCWIHLGGPACVDRSQWQDIDVFFEEVSKTVHAGDYNSLLRFDRVLNRLYAKPPAIEGNPVQILTMHKAKGLEFDFVLLPGLGKGTGKNDKQLIFWLTHKDHMLFAPIEETGGGESEIYKFLNELNKLRDRHETRRLLYVSVTRAKQQVHLFGHLSKKEDGTFQTPPADSMLGHLWPHVEEDWKQRLQKAGTESEPQYRPQPKPPRLKRLAKRFQPPVPPADIETGRPLDIREEREDRPPYFWAGNEARFLGNVLHRCFKDIADQGLDVWDAKKPDSMKTAFKTALLNEGLPFDRADAVADKGVRALQNILEDKRTGRWILYAHEDAESEFALTFAKKDIFSNRILDRTFVDEKGVRWIIDYKTGEHEGSELEAFFEAEGERYKTQLQAYAEILRARGEKRPIRLALYYPLHRRLVEVPDSNGDA
ncbi:UvrD/REP helicase [Nitrospina gracilis 3/211]|uniref:DNA 3'-5' helicase n=1 Tax=Nitrospina gracilis (strain 3/211) TaxID=1266370 RepID=M1YLR5_NITG3|nr:MULTISPECIES: UvrD-helicase domain-containing protein [Nitrospina]MCF8724274.1 ATP-dependent exoDNAse (exonuclease V) beta subunit [Nitrospina sp. Nb-3]CCQ91422.1 UvrD/REP helicase [Nitrospina gracilis 3/211]